MIYLVLQVAVGLWLARVIVGPTKSSPSPARVMGASFVFGVLSLFFNAIMLLFQSVLSFFVVGLIAACGARRSIVVGATILCALFGMGVNLKFLYDEYQKILGLRAEFPIVSLADRLAYEPLRSEQNKSEVALPESTRRRLDSLENDSDHPQWSLRQRLLQQVHDDQYLAFVMAEGFGVIRMIRPNRHWLELREVPLEPLPSRPQAVEPPTAIQTPILAVAEQRDFTASLTGQYESDVKSFLDSERIGFVKSRQVAAGFESHAMTRSPNQILATELSNWQISRLDLVSLLKFAEPRVYLSERLPRMEELRNAETRPVDDFERQTLEQLRGGEDIVVDQQLNTIRMVGAVRAAKQCLDCHSVRRGDLLGAFSYLLDRKQPLPPPKVDGRPVSLRMPL